MDEKFALKAMQDLRYGSVIFCHKERAIAYEATKAKKAAFEKEQQEREAAAAAKGAASQSPSATSRQGEAAPA